MEIQLIPNPKALKRNNDYLIGNSFASGQGANTGSFGKGHKPWNKGMKGYNPSPRTQFRKGHSPATRLPVGIVRQRRDKKTGTPRNFIKIQEPNVWLEYARYVWLRHRGQIPAGLFVHHKDHNSLNDDLANLHLVTKSQLINLHREELHDGFQKRFTMEIDMSRLEWQEIPAAKAILTIDFETIKEARGD